QAFRRVLSRKRVVVAGRALVGLADAFALDDLPASERFFAGGDTTVRGYALDTLGRPEIKDKEGFSIGGSGVVIFNLELRVPVWSAVEAAGFLDAGNVFAHASDIDLGEVRGAIGFGLRYKSPVGPIRNDLGFRVQRDVIVHASQLTGPAAFLVGLT